MRENTLQWSPLTAFAFVAGVGVSLVVLLISTWSQEPLSGSPPQQQPVFRPSTIKAQPESERFVFGVDANRAGVPANANPYFYEDNRVLWLKGWMYADKKAKEEER